MLTIGAFSKLCQTTPNALRYYDEIGLLKPAIVNDCNGYRYYAADQLNTMLLINKLKMYCFSLEEIAEIIRDPWDSGLLLSLAKSKQSHIKSKLNDYQNILNSLNNDIENLERGINIMSYLDNISPKLVETEPRNILYVRNHMDAQKEYGKYLGQLFERKAKENLTAEGPPISIFHGEEYNPTNYDMEIAIPIKEKVEGTRELPGGPCAMATLKGPYSQLASAYSKIKQWMETEGYTLRESPYEIYMTDPSKEKAEDNITEIYFPVKKG